MPRKKALAKQSFSNAFPRRVPFPNAILGMSKSPIVVPPFSYDLCLVCKCRRLSPASGVPLLRPEVSVTSRSRPPGTTFSVADHAGGSGNRRCSGGRPRGSLLTRPLCQSVRHCRELSVVTGGHKIHTESVYPPCSFHNSSTLSSNHSRRSVVSFLGPIAHVRLTAAVGSRGRRGGEESRFSGERSTEGLWPERGRRW